MKAILDDDLALLRVFERLDPIGGEHEVEVERSGTDLDEILSPDDLLLESRVDRKSELLERLDQPPAVLGRLRREDVGVLRRVREAEDDRARLADEEVFDPMTSEDVRELFGLA